MKITVHSVIENREGGISVDEPEINIVTLDADVKKSDRTLFIRYKEEADGAHCRTLITATESGIRLSKSGAIEWDVIFTPGETVKTLYKIPPYSFDAEVTTKRAELSHTDNGYVIRLIYTMNIGGADKSVTVKMTVK